MLLTIVVALVALAAVNGKIGDGTPELPEPQELPKRNMPFLPSRTVEAEMKSDDDKVVVGHMFNHCDLNGDGLAWDELANCQVSRF